MSTTSIATIISIIASGVIAYLIARWQMKKKQIDHYFINSFDIGKGLTDVFPEFQLHYGDEVLSKNVRVLQGGFMNTGRNDIGEDGKQTFFSLILPEGCSVKAVKLSPLVNGLNVNSSINENEKNKIVFSVDGLFKSDECFDYSAIIEVPENMGDIENGIGFDHRILNTEKINIVFIGQTQRKDRRLTKWISIFLIVAAVIVFIWLYYRMKKEFSVIDYVFGSLYLFSTVACLIWQFGGRKGHINNVLGSIAHK